MDSLDKVIGSYFHAVAREPFTYKGKLYEPVESLLVSRSIFDQSYCPPMCAGCCLPFTLDWIDDDPPPAAMKAERREVDFYTVEPNTTRPTVLTVKQDPDTQTKCINVTKDGFCAIHPMAPENAGITTTNPLSCDIPLLTFVVRMNAKPTSASIVHKPFGRGWAMTRLSGEKGADCQFQRATDLASWRAGALRVTEKLERLLLWTEHFGLKTWLPEILNLVSASAMKPERWPEGSDMRYFNRPGLFDSEMGFTKEEENLPT